MENISHIYKRNKDKEVDGETSKIDILHPPKKKLQSK